MDRLAPADNHDLQTCGRRASFRLDPASRVALAIGFVFVCSIAWVHRFTMNPDALSYLEVGEAWLRWDLSSALNRYWNPLYSILTAAAAHLFGSGAAEAIGPHLLEAALYVAAAFGFRRLMRIFLEDLALREPDLAAIDSGLLPIATGLFVWVSVFLIDPAYCVPDLLILVWVLLAAGSWLQLERSGLAPSCSFGAFLGLGYLTKPVLFPLGLVFVFALFLPRTFDSWNLRAASRRAAVAGAIFLAVSALYIIPLSMQKGRFTFSDSGGLAYAWEVNGISPYFHWQGREPGSGQPLHPTREILADPPTYEFDGPRPGTYSPWFDPAYWNDGLKGRFDAADQLQRLRISGSFYLNLLVRGPLALLSGLALFTCLRFRASRAFARTFVSYLGLLAPCGVAFLLYALVFAISRYLAPFLFLCGLWLALASGTAWRTAKFKPCAWAFLALCLGLVGLFSAKSVLREMRQPNLRSYLVHQRVADELARLGLQRGDKIGVIGAGCDSYYARLAGVKIVTETLIFPGHPAWLADAENLRRIADAMRLKSEAKALVSIAEPVTPDAAWRSVPGTPFRILLLRPPN